MVVADEDQARPRRVARDAVVGSLERVPLRVRGRQAVAVGGEGGAGIDEDAGGAAFDIGRHGTDAQRVGGQGHDLHAQRPPSTRKQLPVIMAASSEARKSAALAMSSGWLSRPSGTVAT